jgi:DNA-binding transcriptional regulator GbsR (MarR family)
MDRPAVTSDDRFEMASWYSKRTLCAVLEEMRKCCQTLHFAALPGLIEEAQSMGNRMETKLDQVKDLDRLESFLRERKSELERLRQEFEVVRHALDEHGSEL